MKREESRRGRRAGEGGTVADPELGETYRREGRVRAHRVLGDAREGGEYGVERDVEGLSARDSTARGSALVASSALER